MNREKRKRRLQVKCQLERLETRWLMRASPALSAAAQPPEAVLEHTETRVEILARGLSTQIGQWLSHHPSAAAPLDLKEQKAELERLVPANSAPWGTLRCLIGWKRRATTGLTWSISKSRLGSITGPPSTRCRRGYPV